MNDIQAKENIYNTATAAVNKQQESVSAATTQVTQAQNAYLQSVVHAATLSEKTRRKKRFFNKSCCIWRIGSYSIHYAFN